MHVRGHCSHQTNKRERAHALSLPQNKNSVHDEGNDVSNQCVLARGAALHRSCFSRGNDMSDEIPVKGATSWPPLHYMTQTSPASQPAAWHRKHDRSEH